MNDVCGDTTDLKEKKNFDASMVAGEAGGRLLGASGVQSPSTTKQHEYSHELGDETNDAYVSTCL